MLGYRRADLDLANKLYLSPVKVEFVQVEEEVIGQLMHALKALREEVSTCYEHDQRLLEETEAFIKICRSVVSTLHNYNMYFEEHNKLIVGYFSLTKNKIYADLFKSCVEPIISLIKVLRKQEANGYIDALKKLTDEKKMPTTNTYILTKKKALKEYVEINGAKYKVLSDKQFVELGIFADVVIFLGTPSYFDRKFSSIFYGKETIFLGYSCFENRLFKRASFEGLIKDDDLINTVYKDVTFSRGFSGLNFRTTFAKETVKKSERDLINHYENIENIPSHEKVAAKLAAISHNNYMFLPIGQNVNVIDRDSLKISQERVKDLSAGDLLVFRDQNAASLVREEADNMMGINAAIYRASLEKWKRRLRHNVKNKGIENVSRILMERYGISVAKENNIRNWMSSQSIKPSRLNELLRAFKFDQEEREEILHAANEIWSAHISAGHHISHTLMKELDGNLESVIDENGYYIFESKEFKGTFFNIEEIKRISNETYFIPENETLKILKR